MLMDIKYWWNVKLPLKCRELCSLYFFNCRLVWALHSKALANCRKRWVPENFFLVLSTYSLYQGKYCYDKWKCQILSSINGCFQTGSICKAFRWWFHELIFNKLMKILKCFWIDSKTWIVYTHNIFPLLMTWTNLIFLLTFPRLLVAKFLFNLILLEK